MSFEKFLKTQAPEPLRILDARINLNKYTIIDFSVTNDAISSLDITNPIICQEYIDMVLHKNNALVAYGGYMEKRNLYRTNQNFEANGMESRNIHLGVDFWAKAGTNVQVPIAGKVHSFKNNDVKGDYGPTIILEHNLKEYTFYSLYGHLSLESLKELYVGKRFNATDVLGTLGTPEVNVNYAPHLHFQLIRDIKGYFGDYPGVCTEREQHYYQKNCPDPNFLFSFHE